MKKICFCIFFCLLFSQLLSAAVDSGTYGKNIHWIFDRTSGVLTLSGKGEMSNDRNVPRDWDNFTLKVKKIIITNGITSISDRAFKNCRNTTDITIPPSVKKIGQDVFYGCNSLSGIYITDLSAWCKMEMQTSPLRYAKKLFVNGEILTDLVIPDDITDLGLCFQYCTSITSVTIPKNMKKMNSSAFEGCSNLTHIIWNAKDIVNQTGYSSPLYYLNSQITSITFGHDVQFIQPKLCYEMTKLTSVIIPEGIKTIGDEAFRGCRNLSSVTIASTVKHIGSRVFKECTNLSAIYITDLSAWCKIEYPKRRRFHGTNYQGKYVSEDDVDEEDLPLFYAQNLYVNGKLLTHLVIPNDISEIDHEFQYCKSIKSITFPPTVRRIGDYKHFAFTGCTNLVSVNWNIKNYTYAAPWTYSNAESITSFTFGTNVEVIPINCCKDMKEMTSITIPPSVKQIKDGAFHDCEDLDSVFITDITAWCAIQHESFALSWARHLYANGKLVTEVQWPEKIKQVGHAFRFYTSLEKIEIPDGVTNISSYAFQGCRNLQSVAIPSTIQAIGEEAFAGCTGLLQIDLPNTIQSIGDNAFKDVLNLEYYSSRISGAPWGARSLNGIILDGLVYADENAITLRACPSTYRGDIVIPSSVRQIKENAFKDCIYLTAVKTDDLSNWLKITFMNANANPLKYAHKLIVGDKLLTNLQLPKIKSIKDYAFVNCTSIENLTIPNGVEKVGLCAFEGCTNLQSVKFPTTTISLDNYSFGGCVSLVPIIPSNVYCYSSQWNQIFYQVPYVICDTTREDSPWGARKKVHGGYLEGGIVYNDSSKTIIEKCLPETKGDVVIPSTVTKIEANAFRNCSHITSVTIPPSVKEVAANAFNSCHSLTTVHITDIEKWCLIEFSNARSNPMYYANQLLINREPIQNVSIPKTIKEIKAFTFWNCQSLVSVHLHDNITAIGWTAFYNCTHLEHINLPQSITAIESYAFYNCRSLRSIEIPQNVVKISSYTFEFCSNLNSVVLSSNTTTIGERSFYSCINLRKISLPKTITEIGDYAFAFCTALCSLKLPNSIDKIGKDAFLYVRDIIYSGSLSEAPWNAKAINGYVDGNFVYSDASKTELLACSSDIQGDIYIPKSVTKIHSNAFHYCRNILSLHVPETVTEIGNSAFYMIPNVIYSGTSSGEPWGALCINGYINELFVFKDSSQQELVACSPTRVGDIIIPEGVLSIGENTFHGCQYFRSVSFPKTLRIIKNGAFKDCGLLEEIMFSKGIKDIKVDSTAWGALFPSLQKVVMPEGMSLSSIFNAYTKIHLIPKDSSHLEIMTYSLYEPNGNGIIDTDEPCEIRFCLHNTGKGDAVGCKVNIKARNEFPFLHVDKKIEVSDIPADDSILVKIPIFTDKNATAVTIPIQISITEVQGDGVTPFTIPIQLTTFASPQLQAEFSLYSSSSLAQKTEPLTVKMVVRNIGKGIARDVSYSIVLPNTLQHVSGKLQQTWDVIYAGEQKEFSFKINSTEQTPDSISLDYVLKEKYGLYAQPGYISVVFGKTPTFRITSSEDKALAIAGTPRIGILTNTSVAIMRPDWYSKYNNPQNIKSPFPYAVIKLELKGDKESVEIAKQALSLTMNNKHIVEVKDNKDSNTIYFLVHCRNEFIDIDCGDGCEPINIWKERLEPNKVYYGIVHVNILK